VTVIEEAQLALPSGEREEARNRLTLAVLLIGSAATMAFGARMAAYINVRALARDWPPDEIKLDNYLGVTLFVTLLLSVATAEWAPYALKRDNRRQTMTALAVTMGLGVAFLNLAWYAGSQFDFGAADNAFATLAWTGLVASCVVVGLGIGFLAVALARTAGNQVVAGRHEVVRAAAWAWQFAALGWLIVFTGLYVFQHK
jgi:heme/copper-type cytochrome/quinol oxidase subunit 3